MLKVFLAVYKTQKRRSKFPIHFTGQKCDIGAQLDILNEFLPNYRQCVLLQHNGIYLEDKNGKLLPRFFFNPEIGPANEEFDEEYQGMKGMCGYIRFLGKYCQDLKKLNDDCK